jgi:UTP-glucose-1-phosphate uridylyltransferase
MVDELLSRCSSINLMALVHVFQQLGSGGFGDAVLEVRADIGGAVRAVLLAQVAENHRGGLLWSELRLLFVFLGGRHRSGV